jgi:hypothetical protein
VHVNHAPVLPHLQHQRISGDERVRALVQRPGAKRLDLGIQIASHHRHLPLRQAGDPQGFDQLLHPPRGHAKQVARGDHAGECAFGAHAALEQPVWKIAAGPQLRDRQIDRADTGVEVAVPVAVAGVDPLSAAFAVLGATQRVGLRSHDRLNKRGKHPTQQTRTGCGELIGERLARVDTLTTFA